MIGPKINLMRMSFQNQFRYLLALAFVGFTGAAFSIQPEMLVMAERAKVAVVAQDVTVDGKPRPDIAQALADSLSAGLLKAGGYRVYQPEAAVPRAKGGKGKKGDLMLGRATATRGKLPEDVDITFAFNVVGQDDDYHLTMKKIRTADGEVLEVHELSTTGRLDKVFGLVPNVLLKLQAKVPAKPAFPRTQSPAVLVASTQPAAATGTASAPSANASYWTQPSEVPPEYAEIDFTKVPKALVYQQIGSIQMINEAWKFCIIRPKGDARLKMADNLHVLYDEDGRVYASLRVANFDSGRVIADFGNYTPGYHKLFPGDEVFGWAPPLH